MERSLIYHAFNRSNMRVPIFHTDDDYLHFMKLLKKYSERFFLKIYHWVILSNHFHILFQLKDALMVPKVMAGLDRSYTHYHHRNYGSSGFLWQGRFKLQAVQKERYLIACGRYIERNPVRAGCVQNAWEYPYSSARFYCMGLSDNITSEDPAYEGSGLDRAQRSQGYRNFLQDDDAAEESLFRNNEAPLGDEWFVARLQKIAGRYYPQRKGRLRREDCRMAR